MCDTTLHESYRSALGTVAWIVSIRAELVVYAQVLLRRAHSPRIEDCQRANFVMLHMKRHECGFESVKFNHPLKLVGFIDVAFKTQPDEPTGLALRGLAATLQEDDSSFTQPMSKNGKVNFIDFIVRRQRRVARSTFSAELNGLVDSVEQMLLLQMALHQTCRGTQQSLKDMLDLLENGGLYPWLDIAVDACAAYDAIVAIDACEPQGSSLTFHLISVRDRLVQGIIRRVHCVDTRDWLVHGLTKGGIDRSLLQNVSNGCSYKLAHQALTHSKTQVGSTTNPADAVS